MQGLAQNEPRLRQRPLGRIDQQQHAVDHGQAPFDLAAESAWPGVSTMLILTSP